MTSARLRRWLERELAGALLAGHESLVRRLLALETEADFPTLERLVHAHRELSSDAERAGLREIAAFLRYVAARTLVFPLDRPKPALPELVQLCSELAIGALRGSVLHSLADLELLRAFHKIDAPGYRDEIVAGVRSIFPRVADDAGPASELLDIFWRTAFWCRDPELMREGTRLADGRTGLLRFNGSYWLARERSLRGRADEAAALLTSMLESRSDLEEHGPAWRHYVEVELAFQEAALGRIDAADRRLETVRAQAGRLDDPMLAWDLERSAAAVARLRGDAAAELACWRRGLAVLHDLGTDRLAAEFALALGEAAARAGDEAARDEARRLLAEVLPQLRSAGELAPKARALGLY